MTISDDGSALGLVRDHTILSVVAGSRAYGLATDAGDVDLRGVHLLPLEEIVGLETGAGHV